MVIAAFDTADLFVVAVGACLGIYCLALAVNFRGAAEYVVQAIWRPYLGGRRVDRSDERAMLRGARFVGAVGCALAVIVIVAAAGAGH